MRTLTLLLLPIVLLSVLLPINAVTPLCEDRIFQGFDSRLSRNLIGRLPKGTDKVVGFEMVRNRPFVAFSHEILAFDGDEISQIPFAPEIRGLAVGYGGNLYVQTVKGIFRAGGRDFERDPILGGYSSARIFGSGASVFAVARELAGTNNFSLVRQDGAELPFASLDGTLHAVSWNKVGLAAVVGNELVVWNSGSAKAILLADDEGLSAARDVAMVGPEQAVVALPSAVVLVTRATKTVIVSMTARLQWSGGILYLLDERFGPIWSIKGIEKLGGSQDRSHAVRLIQAIPRESSSEDNPSFQEAARIIGCMNARRVRNGETLPR